MGDFMEGGMEQSMAWITLGSIVVAVFYIVRYELYRKQVNSFRESIQFIEQHNSNMRITQEVSNKEIKVLVNDLNRLMQKYRYIEREYVKKEQELKDLVTYLSHDIRTPLTSLDGYFQLLMDCTDLEDRDRYHQIIRGRIDSLRVLLEELFMYMKLQNNAYEVELSDCNLNNVLYDSILGFYQEFSNLKIEPVVTIPEGKIVINGNKLAMTRVMQNIIKNVLEHGSNRFELKVWRSDHKVFIEFENEYSYDSKIDVSKLFDRFYRADKARTSTSTGLGLAIAKELVERMKGTIEARVDEKSLAITLQFDLM